MKYTYQRLIKFNWNSDSRSDYEFAVSNLTGLCRELARLQIYHKHPEEETKWNGKWKIPAEMSDTEEWLDWAIEFLTELGHRVSWNEFTGPHGEVGECTVQLLGGYDDGFPLLLGYDSDRWLANNLKKGEN